MDNSLENNKLEVVNDCQTGGCGCHVKTCGGVVDLSGYKDDIEIRQVIYNERKQIKDNEKLYKEIRKDFNPMLWGFLGLMAGTVLGVFVEKFLQIGASVVYTAIFGAFLGVTICINKNKAKNREHFYQE